MNESRPFIFITMLAAQRSNFARVNTVRAYRIWTWLSSNEFYLPVSPYMEIRSLQFKHSIIPTPHPPKFIPRPIPD